MKKLYLVVILLFCLIITGCDEKKEYLVTFSGGQSSSGEVVESITTKKGESIVLPSNTYINDGYLFIGWSDGTSTYQVGDVYIPTANKVTFAAVWEEITQDDIKYNVTFDKNGSQGTDPVVTDKVAGELFIIPECSYEKKDYNFIGWNDGTSTYQFGDTYTMPNKNVTFTAVWQEKQYYTITFDINGGTGTVPVVTKKEFGKTFTIPNSSITKTDNTLMGWNDGTKTYTAGSTYTMPSKNVTFKAVWQEKQYYTITFDINGGTGTVPVVTKKEFGKTFTIPNSSITKTDNTLMGWNDGTKTYTAGSTYTMPSKNVTFKAVWQEKQYYTITFESGGGTGTAPTMTKKESGNKITLPNNTFSKEGQNFAGWNDGTKTYTAGSTYTMPAKNVIFVATWVTPAASAIIVNHNNAQAADILSFSSSTISKIKSLKTVFWHTSHGSQLATGLRTVNALHGSSYLYSFTDEPEFIDLGTSNWDQKTRTYLNNHSDIDVVLWSWCGQLQWMTSTDVNTYLSKMSSLEVEYSQVKFVYMTGHLYNSSYNLGGSEANTNANNAIIREYCKNNKKILYDFADIESYNPDGTYYGDKHATDSCDYDSDGNGSLDANWGIEWQNNHPSTYIEDTYSHTKAINVTSKGYATWYLLSKLV